MDLEGYAEERHLRAHALLVGLCCLSRINWNLSMLFINFFLISRELVIIGATNQRAHAHNAIQRQTDAHTTQKTDKPRRQRLAALHSDAQLELGRPEARVLCLRLTCKLSERIVVHH